MGLSEIRVDMPGIRDDCVHGGAENERNRREAGAGRGERTNRDDGAAGGADRSDMRIGNRSAGGMGRYRSAEGATVRVESA